MLTCMTHEGERDYGSMGASSVSKKGNIRDSREKCDWESLTDRQTTIYNLEHYVNWDTRENTLLFYYSFNLNYRFILV